MRQTCPHKGNDKSMDAILPASNKKKGRKKREQRRDAPTTIPRPIAPQKPSKATLDIGTKLFSNKKGENGFWILRYGLCPYCRNKPLGQRCPWAKKDGQPRWELQGFPSTMETRPKTPRQALGTQTPPPMKAARSSSSRSWRSKAAHSSDASISTTGASRSLREDSAASATDADESGPGLSIFMLVGAG